MFRDEKLTDEISKIKSLIEDKSKLYSTIAIVAPFVIAYLLSPDLFPENTLYGIFFILFYTGIFHFIYLFYIKVQMKIRSKIRKNIIPRLIDKKEDYYQLYEELIKAESNPHFPNIIIRRYIPVMNKFIGQLENVAKNIAIIKNYQEDLHEKINEIQYQKFDNILIFTGSFLLLSKYYFDLSQIDFFYIKLLDSNGFIILFAIVILIHIIYAHIAYLDLIIKAQILFLLTPIAKHFLSKTNDSITLLDKEI